MARIPNYIRDYVSEDIDSISSQIQSKYNLNVTATAPKITSGREDNEIWYSVDVSFKTSQSSVDVTWEYLEQIGSNDVMMDLTTEQLAYIVCDRLTESVTASQDIRTKHRIVAADEDPENDAFSDFDEFADDEGELADDADTVGDSIDDMADTLDDMQDSLDDIKEDDPNIEIDNNITNHLIAECENCGGVFISAIEMSDHLMESVHGICPLCEQETDQYLKWVIRDVKAEDDELN